MSKKAIRKRNKIEEREKKWKKRICLTEDTHNFIHYEMRLKNYKTMAGTLDMIINKYKSRKRGDKKWEH